MSTYKIGRTYYRAESPLTRFSIFKVCGCHAYALVLHRGQVKGVEVINARRALFMRVCEDFDRSAEGLIALLDSGRIELKEARKLMSEDFGVTCYQTDVDGFIAVISSFIGSMD